MIGCRLKADGLGVGKVYGKCIDDRRAILQVFPLICSVDESEHSDESGTVHEMEAEEERSCCSFAIYTLGELACRVKSSSEYSEVKQPIAVREKIASVASASPSVEVAELTQSLRRGSTMCPQLSSFILEDIPPYLQFRC